MGAKRSLEDLASLGLHHGADNHDSSAYDVELKYPSGLSERLGFGVRTTRNNHRYARTIDPFEDLLGTIYFMLDHYVGAEGPQAETCTALRHAWQSRASWTAAGGIQALKNTIGAINQLTGHQGYEAKPISAAFAEHFFDQLHDRVVADNCAALLHRSSSRTTENVYGELRPRFLSRIFQLTGLDGSSVYLDLGAGVGQTAMQAALETQCEAHGIERERRVHALAQYQLVQFWERARLYNLPFGHVTLRQGDFLASQYVQALLPAVDVVLLNNLKLEAETDLAVCQMLEATLKVGARVVSTRSLKPLKRGQTAGATEAVDGWVVQKLRYEAGSVSWTDAEGDFFFSTKLFPG